MKADIFFCPDLIGIFTIPGFFRGAIAERSDLET
jgi:hypothetical protein